MAWFARYAIEVLAPGDYALVVKNQVAFEARYGAGLPVAGEYPSDNLRNSGERLKLSFGAGTTIHDVDEFTDASPWPEAADGDSSLVLIGVDDFLSPDHGDPANWRPSRFPLGSPGKADGVDYAAWKERFEVSEDFGDADRDGVVALLEFFLGGDPTTPTAHLLPVARAGVFLVDGVAEEYLTISFPREVGADGLRYVVEFSEDLVTWVADGVRVAQEASGLQDGVVTETWRAGHPRGERQIQFARLRVEMR